MSEGLIKNSYMTALVSFAALARFGRMSETVKFLGVSRQTISRHMDFLDELLGGPVVRTVGRRHEITPRGETILDSADQLMTQLHAMTVDDGLMALMSKGLQSVALKTSESTFRGQQHPLWRAYEDSPELIQKGLTAWKNCNYDMLHPQVEEISPYMLSFRRTPNGWVCTHVGEQSAYAQWFGWEWAKSAIGMLVGDAISGPDYFRFTSTGFNEVLHTGGCRLDHHDVKSGTKGDGTYMDVTYHRLVMSFLLPDKAPILSTLVVLSDNVNVPDILSLK